jgi:hypothetical protein
MGIIEAIKAVKRAKNVAGSYRSHCTGVGEVKASGIYTEPDVTV